MNGFKFQMKLRHILQCHLAFIDIIIEPTYFKTAREITKGDKDLPEYMLDGTVGDFTDFPITEI